MPRTARPKSSTVSTKTSGSRQTRAGVAPSHCPRSTSCSDISEATTVDATDDIYTLPRDPSPMPHARTSKLKRQPIKEVSELACSLQETTLNATSPVKIESKSCSSTENFNGLEALDAVNELYRKLKETRLESQVLRKEKQVLSDQLAEANARVRKIEAEWKAEQDKYVRQRKKWDTEGHKDSQEAQQQLFRISEVLSTFRKAAGGLLPLLDVIIGDAGTEGDDAAEELKTILDGCKRSASVGKGKL